MMLHFHIHTPSGTVSSSDGCDFFVLLSISKSTEDARLVGGGGWHVMVWHGVARCTVQSAIER